MNELGKVIAIIPAAGLGVRMGNTRKQFLRLDGTPILALTLSAKNYDHFTLRRIAAQMTDQIKEIADVSEVKIIGGQRRQLRILLDEQRMSSRGIAPAAMAEVLV